MHFQKVLIIDFGSQYTHLISKICRKLGVYSEIIMPDVTPDLKNVIGIILSGGPASTSSDQADEWILSKYISPVNTPPVKILGICYGAQYLAKKLGGQVRSGVSREYGSATLTRCNDSKLLADVHPGSEVWMSHSDTIVKLPPWSRPICSTSTCIAGFSALEEQIYGLQFHPEVVHTTDGQVIFENFLHLCNANYDFTPDTLVNTLVNSIRKQVSQDSQIVLAISGGVDSTVTAKLLQKAIGPERVHCVYINNGFLRKNEFKRTQRRLKKEGIQVCALDCSDQFIEAVKGVNDPEQRRKIIGNMFIVILKQVIGNLHANFLAQGTIYPDVIESNKKSVIKSHHNVGGLPDDLGVTLIEPLRMLFKDDVRKLGIELGLSSKTIYQHPFPGPGLAIRILCNIDHQTIEMLQQADSIFTCLLKKYNFYDKIWQSAAILLDQKSVGVMGDCRTFERVVVLRAVTSVDGMTARIYDFPCRFLEIVSNLIVNNVPGVNRVVYDVTSKPPGTIEWY